VDRADVSRPPSPRGHAQGPHPRPRGRSGRPPRIRRRSCSRTLQPDPPQRRCHLDRSSRISEGVASEPGGATLSVLSPLAGLLKRARDRESRPCTPRIVPCHSAPTGVAVSVGRGVVRPRRRLASNAASASQLYPSLHAARASKQFPPERCPEGAICSFAGDRRYLEALDRSDPLPDFVHRTPRPGAAGLS
jgi:hypothetical protein